MVVNEAYHQGCPLLTLSNVFSSVLHLPRTTFLIVTVE